MEVSSQELRLVLQWFNLADASGETTGMDVELRNKIQTLEHEAWLSEKPQRMINNGF